MTNKELLIYQGKNGEIFLKEDENNETIWARQSEIADIFWIDRTVATRHINNIFKDWEIDEKSNVQKMHITNSDKPVKFYNLDIILAVWYRTNSSQAIKFRKWATKTLKEHITKGYTINPKRIQGNYDNFLQAVEEVRKLIPAGNENIKTSDILELVKHFANTWFSLESYDEDKLPLEGFTKTDLKPNAEELYRDVANFKNELIEKGEATELFAQEKNKEALEGIFWNIFQSFDGNDVYPTVEEKAAHFLYFVVKNHPFVDGNKRTGAFCFLWFLSKVGFKFQDTITPAALTAITLLVAESNPQDKQRIVGLVMLLLKK